MSNNTIDSLIIEIDASSSNANSALDKLADRLLKIDTRLRGIKVGEFSKNMNVLKKSVNGFTGADNLEKAISSLRKLSNINAEKMIASAIGVTELSNSLKGLSGVSIPNLDGIDNLVGSARKLGGKSVSQAVQNLPQLSSCLSQFVSSMNSIGALNFDVTGLSNLISSISKLGGTKATQAAKNLSPISAQLQNFIRQLNNIGSVNFDMAGLNSLVSSVSKLGGKSSTQAIPNINALTTAIRQMMQTLSTAPQVSGNVIQMTNAMANLASQGSKVGTAARSLSNGIKGYSNTLMGASKKTSSFSSFIGTLYQKFFLVKRVAALFGKTITLAMDYIEDYNYFNVTFGKIASEWSQDFEKYGYENADAYAKSFEGRLNELNEKMAGVKLNASGLLESTGMANLGIDISELTTYEANLGALTNSLGLVGEASVMTSKALTMLTADVSSLKNIDLQTVMNNFSSGIIGQSRALYKYGIDITNATLQNYAYQYGIEKSITAMTQAEKIQLRLLAILDQSKVAWGDLANTINSPSNQIRMFTNNIKALGRTIGGLFIPIISKVLPYINGMIVAIRRLIEWLAALFGVKLDMSQFGQGYDSSGITDSLEDISDSIDDVADSYDKAAEAAKKYENTVLSIDQLHKLNDTPESNSDSGGGSGSSGGVGGVIDLTDEIGAALADYEAIWNAAFANMENRVDAFANKIVSGVKWAAGEIKIGFDGAFKADTSQLLKNVERLGEAVREVWQSPEVKNAMADFASQALQTLGAVHGSITSVVTSFATGVTGGIASAKESLIDFDKVKISSIFGNLTDILKTTEDLAGAASTVATAFESEGFQKIVEVLAKIADVTILNTIDQVTGLISDLWALAAKPFVDNADKIKELLENVFELFSILLEPVGKLFDKIAENSTAYKDSPLHAFFEQVGNAMSSGFGNKLDDVNQALETLISLLNGEITLGDIWEKIFKLIFGETPSDVEISLAVTLTKVGEKLGEKLLDVSVKVASIKDALEEKWDEAKTYWKKKTDLSEIKTTYEDIKKKLQEKWDEATKYWGSKTKLKDIIVNFPDILAKAKSAWSKLTGWWTNPKLKDIIANFPDILAKAKSAWSKLTGWWTNPKLKDIIVNFPNILSKAKTAWNNLVKWAKSNFKLNFHVTYTTKGLGPLKKSIVKALGLSGWPSFSFFESGGFPQLGELFVARESGPEWIGRMGSKTAVANNDQIAAGIAAAVQPAVYNAMMMANASKGGNSGGKTVELPIYLDSKEIGRAVLDYEKMQNKRYVLEPRLV